MPHHFSDTVFWFFVLLSGFVVWVSAGVFYTWKAHQRIHEQEKEIRALKEYNEAAVKRLNELERNQRSPFPWLGRVN
jgi:hypothetical protein